MSRITATRQHVFAAGHRLLGHEGKCTHLHGHNYRVHFTCEAPGGGVDALGRVLDFGEIKSRLCQWLEEHWDHKFLVYREDASLAELLQAADPGGVVVVPFNPTAENMASHLLSVVGPRQLEGTGLRLAAVKVEETPNCSAEARASAEE